MNLAKYSVNVKTYLCPFSVVSIGPERKAVNDLSEALCQQMGQRKVQIIGGGGGGCSKFAAKNRNLILLLHHFYEWENS